MSNRPISLLVFLVLACSFGVAQSSPPKFRVGLTITTDDESLKALVKLYLNRELRSLHDVEPVDGYTSTSALMRDVSKQNRIHYALNVMAQKTAQRYVVSVVFLRRYNNLPAQKFVESLGADAMKQYLQTYIDSQQEDLYPTGEIFLSMSLYTVAEESQIRGICEQIVADLDTKILNSRR